MSDRELLLEIGCEELPASWLPPAAAQLGDQLEQRLAEQRLEIPTPIETFGTPRRLTARIAKLAERQTDLEEVLMGPAVASAFGPDGTPTRAAIGFARKQGVEVVELERVETAKGVYLTYRKHQRGKATSDVLPDALGAVLRDMSFPKQMHWDAWLDDGRGELLFGRPIRWLLFLYGGRVVPFTIKRSDLALSGQVHEVRSAAVTYGHRFLATTGRSGRAIKVRTFEEYRSRLAESFVLLDRSERHDKIARELDAHARRLGGRVGTGGPAQSALLHEVPDLVEYPSVVAGTFAPEFLELPEEVLATTMIHHQHFFPVFSPEGRLLPAFLAVTNTQADNSRTIARNCERVLTARLRDARFFWDADRKVPLSARVQRLDTVLFHKTLGTYREKAGRVAPLARWLAGEALGVAEAAADAETAGWLAKADLTTDMVREFTELQGTMGGIYAREEGHSEPVWRTIYYHYLPTGVEQNAPPSGHDLGSAAIVWAAVSLADKLDTVCGLFAAGERPTGTRDPFGLRRQAHGILKILVDLPELTGLNWPLALNRLIDRATSRLEPDQRRALDQFLQERLRHLFDTRGYAFDEINAVLRPIESPTAADRAFTPLDTRRRLEALRQVRGSADFEALAVAFKRVKNLAKELKGGPAATLNRLTEPSEAALVLEYETRGAEIHGALASGDYPQAFRIASGFRPVVDRFFTDVFVMVDDRELRAERLTLVWRLHELLLELADISEIVPRTES
ncbi:MAG: glycine--tRNA ligase subunit beta [Acidobacteria bacterium]|nr:glycine--tRNA ligase subunit beta [Acidobacteriota bacterium]